MFVDDATPVEMAMPLDLDLLLAQKLLQVGNASFVISHNAVLVEDFSPFLRIAVC